MSYRCVAKKQCFAPATLYRPFGKQAAGVRSLSQFQALQDGEKELASLRELGLTDAEIQLWQSRDTPEAEEKVKPAGDSELAQNKRNFILTLVCVEFANSPQYCTCFLYGNKFR